MIHVAVHDAAPRHRERLERIDKTLRSLGVGWRYSMLVVPDFHGKEQLSAHPEFTEWLRSLADSGVEMLLHGYRHLDNGGRKASRAGWRERHMTDGEGEFLSLDAEEARRRIREGRRMVEDALGRGIDGFVAPAWLYGKGVKDVLAEEGFLFAENHFRVWSPRSGRSLIHSPVVSWASRTPGLLKRSMIWSRLATILLRPLRSVRVGIHPHDFDHPPLIAELERVLQCFLRSRAPVLLGDLLGDRDGGSTAAPRISAGS